jgi:hypothetical protein
MNAAWVPASGWGLASRKQKKTWAWLYLCLHAECGYVRFVNEENEVYVHNTLWFMSCCTNRVLGGGGVTWAK